MVKKRILIVGGYGRTGMYTARLLLQETNCCLTLAGRSSENANSAASLLNTEYSCERVAGLGIDIDDPATLAGPFSDCDIVVVCVPFRKSKNSHAFFNEVIKHQLDYIDINTDNSKHELLEELSDTISNKGLHFLTDGGVVPGVPSLLPHMVEGNLDSTEYVHIGIVGEDQNIGYHAALDFMSDISDSSLVFKEGQWQKSHWNDVKPIDFQDPFGEVKCSPGYMFEMHDIPEKLKIPEVILYYGGTNWFLHILMTIWGMFKLDKSLFWTDLGARLFAWGNRKFSSPPYGCSLVMEAKGEKDGEPKELKVFLSHDDSYSATSIALTAAIIQMINNRIKKPGVSLMGHALKPDLFLEDVTRMGMKTDVSITSLSPAP